MEGAGSGTVPLAWPSVALCMPQLDPASAAAGLGAAEPVERGRLFSVIPSEIGLLGVTSTRSPESEHDAEFKVYDA